MSSIEDFNRIEDCNKIKPDCIDGEFRVERGNDTTICFYTSWGDHCEDLEPYIKAGETCTRLYLSPEEGNPNCLAYDAECGESCCINGDDLSRIISMRYLKDVKQDVELNNGDVYMYNEQTDQFEPFNLQEFVDNVNNLFNNLNQTINDLKAKLTPPEGAPDNVRVVFGNINDYSDPNVKVNEGSGTITTLDKNHGLYSHSLSETRYADQVFG